MAFVGAAAGAGAAARRASSGCARRNQAAAAAPVVRMAAVAAEAKTGAAGGAKASAAPATNSKFERMRAKFGTRQTVEVDTGFSYADFETAIQKYERSTGLGDLVVGTIVQMERGGTFVDIGAKSSAFLPSKEASISETARPEDVLELGEQREFEIISAEDASGMLTLSLKRIEFRRCWERLAQMQAEDVTVHSSVDGFNRGGAMVRIENLRGFVPGSHLSVPLNDELIGMALPLKFIEVDPEKGRVVLSHRRAAVQNQMGDFENGQVVTGVVRGVKPYGIFVDVGGVTGLLHISQISHDRIDDPSQVIKVGDTVKCMVISADKDKGRISLSTKTLEPEPGDMLKDSKKVFAQAEEMAARYHQRLEEERKAAADVADDIVSSLDISALDDLPVASGN